MPDIVSAVQVGVRMKIKKKEFNFFTVFAGFLIVVAVIYFFVNVALMPFINNLNSIDFNFFESNQNYLVRVCEENEGRIIEGDCFFGSKCDKFFTTAVCSVRGNIFQISSYHNDTIIDAEFSARIKKHCSIITKTNEQSNCSEVFG